MPKPTANQRIIRAMRLNEQQVLRAVRRDNKAGVLFRSVLMSHAWHNALTRLKARGRVRYVKRPLMGGYAVAGVQTRGLV